MGMYCLMFTTFFLVLVFYLFVTKPIRTKNVVVMWCDVVKYLNMVHRKGLVLLSINTLIHMTRNEFIYM